MYVCIHHITQALPQKFLGVLDKHAVEPADLPEGRGRPAWIARGGPGLVVAGIPGMGEHAQTQVLISDTYKTIYVNTYVYI